MTAQSLRIASTPADARTAIDWAIGIARRTALADRIDDLELALAEVLNNVILHAYRGRPDAEIMLEMRHSDARIEVIVTDFGTPIPQSLRDVPQPSRVVDATRVEDLPESGFGFAIIRACADALKYRSDAGTNQTSIIFVSD